MSFVTFVVPTLGRPTLERALDSLRAQTVDDWNAVVVGDGVSPLEGISDETVFEWQDEPIVWSSGNFSSAGLARNHGIEILLGGIDGEHSEWIAFLDDDDVVLPSYVQHLKEHADDYPWADVVVFRMDHPTLGVLPRSGGHLALGSVGISFAVRRHVAMQARFVAEEIIRGYHEDWQMISEFISTGKKIFISPHTEYIVRDWRNR